jgi:hypothetical protein
MSGCVISKFWNKLATTYEYAGDSLEVSPDVLIQLNPSSRMNYQLHSLQ